MPIVAPDLLIPTAGPYPSGWILSATRPSLVVETNGRGATLSTSSGRLEVTPIDGYGDLVGASTVVAPGAPMTLAAAGRWRVSYAGDGDDGSPLAFS